MLSILPLTVARVEAQPGDMKQDPLLYAPWPGGLPDRLLTRLPIAARGPAMASWLLSDGPEPDNVERHR
jgi:hypothetical protein